jgi:drug/metabolite transporter (DMT)-like permease
MIPILGGLGAALAFTVSILVSARASRLTGAASTLAGAMALGLAITLPAAIIIEPSPALTPEALVWSGVSGVGNVVGLLLIYTAYRVGAVGIISTIASTEGAISAVLSVLAGEILQPGSGPVLGVVALGVALAAAGGHEEEEGVEIPRARSIRAAALSIVAALSFGLGLYASGRVSELLPVAWAILPARVAGVLLVTIPLAVAGRVRISRAAAPYVAATGLAEIVGYLAYVVGAREGIAVASVLTSMFAPFATLAAFVLFRERLGRRQIVGIGLVASGVIGLGVLQG